MPRKLKKPRAVPNCPNLTDERYLEAHAHLDRKVPHEKRQSSSSQRGYNNRWQEARKMLLFIKITDSTIYSPALLTIGLGGLPRGEPQAATWKQIACT